MNNHFRIEAFWYSQSKLTYLVWPLHFIFLIIVQLKYLLYKIGFLSSNKFSKAVLVIGNISVGGTGKTPFINQLVQELNKRKIKVGIVSRGYCSNITTVPHQVTKLNTVDEVGDEAFMQFSNLNIPIVIDPNRSRAVNYLIENNDIDLVISDDGLQHYKMSRDLEFVMFDGQRKFGNQMILPLGPLREPVRRLNSVDLVIQNGEQSNSFSNYVVKLNPVSLINLKSLKETSLKEFSGKSAHCVAAIGNPNRFFNAISKLCKIESETTFLDHYAFKLNDFESFNDDIVVMTEKDATKCFSFAKEHWYYLKVEMSLDKNLIEKIISKIIAVIDLKN